MVESDVSPKVIVVGAGPAGTRCAETLVAHGIRPTIIDENKRSGGQIYRRQPDNFTRSYVALYGAEAGNAESAHKSFDALLEHVDYLPDTSIWNISDKQVYSVSDSGQAVLPFDSIILCTGATDRMMPLNGWNFAGTYSLGGAQIALKAQACSIGRRVVFVGTGPLLYLVAAQYVKAGASVAAVLDTSPWIARVLASPKLMAQPAALWNGVKLTVALRLAKVPIYTGVEPLEIQGTGEGGVSGISFTDKGGRRKTIECDAVAMGYHVRPETQLADLARCEFRFDEGTRQWLPRVDSDGRSSVEGVYLAGDGVRVLGAAAAETSGKLAALALLQDLDFSPSAKLIKSLRSRLRLLQRFAQGLSQAFPWPVGHVEKLADDTILCRCEAVSVGDLRRSLLETSATESNRAKAFSRVGMGRCQGRYCGNAVAEIIAESVQLPIEQAGRLRGQAPVKPLAIGSAKDSA